MEMIFFELNSITEKRNTETETTDEGCPQTRIMDNWKNRFGSIGTEGLESKGILVNTQIAIKLQINEKIR